MDSISLKKCILFKGASESEIEQMLGCLGAEKKSYKKGEIIYNIGDIVRSLGIVLHGSAEISSIDFWGNQSVMDRVQPLSVFAESYACLDNEPMMVEVSAAEDCEILFLNVSKIFNTCADTCVYHQKLIYNLLMISAQKNLDLSRRMFHISPKTIRSRLLSYLSYQAAKQGKSDFTIPFDRRQMADYLGVDRSALSNELSKMQKDGLLTVQKNHFILSDDFDK